MLQYYSLIIPPKQLDFQEEVENVLFFRVQTIPVYFVSICSWSSTIETCAAAGCRGCCSIPRCRCLFTGKARQRQVF